MELETVTAHRVYFICPEYSDEGSVYFPTRQMAVDALKLLQTTSENDETPVVKLSETKACELFDAGENYSKAKVKSLLVARRPLYAKNIEDAMTSYGIIVENSI